MSEVPGNGQAAMPAPPPETLPTPPPSEVQRRPRPRAPAAILVLAVLAVGYTLWATQDLVLPILLAVFFALLGNPFMRAMQRVRIPRFLGALVLVAAGISGTVWLGMQLVGPAQEWMREAPRQLRSLGPQLEKITRPVQQANEAAENIARAAGGATTGGKPVQVVRTEAADPYKALTATPRAIASVLAVVLLTYFFMVFGQDLQRNAIALLPSRQQKRLTVEIMQAIESEISRYVLTISVINLAVGMVFAALLHLVLDMEWQQALLWGTMAFLLNYAPYVGPLMGVIATLLMGVMVYDETWQKLAPAAMYLGLHTLEGQIITPLVLGRQMAISPLILVLVLMVCGWLWGIIGLLLAVPMLVCLKIVLSRVEGWEGWAKLLE